MNQLHSYQIKELCTVKRGGSPRPIEKFLTAKDAPGYNWLLIGDIENDADYIEKTGQKITEEGLSKTTLVKAGELILSNSMSFGRPYITKIETCIHDGWLALKDIRHNLIDTKFFYYLLKSTAIQKKFNNLSAGSGVKNLKREIVENILIKIPDLGTQQKIVQILDTWNNAINVIKIQQGQEDNLMKYLYAALLSGYKTTGKPNEYVDVELGKIANIERGKTLTAKEIVPGDIPVIAGGIDSPYKHNQYTHENVITVSASGANAGYVDYRHGKIWASDCNVIYGKEGISDTMYIFSWLVLLQKLIYQLQTGGAQPHVHAKDLAKLKISLPPLEIQQDIVMRLSTQAAKISRLEEYRDNLQNQYKYLLNHLISGDFDLTNIELENGKEQQWLI